MCHVSCVTMPRARGRLTHTRACARAHTGGGVYVVRTHTHARQAQAGARTCTHRAHPGARTHGHWRTYGHTHHAAHAHRHTSALHYCSRTCQRTQTQPAQARPGAARRAAARHAPISLPLPWAARPRRMRCPDSYQGASVCQFRAIATATVRKKGRPIPQFWSGWSGAEGTKKPFTGWSFSCEGLCAALHRCLQREARARNCPDGLGPHQKPSDKSGTRSSWLCWQACIPRPIPAM